ncbi:predicted exosome subunit [Aeropyrum camini SY1 = JCM 12091]|uniref:Predicted exosome subunit n=2 Tax=Aeropyrum camini TaxID=229980 RepID=U3TEJ5_9CREN|nr:predicted exosome subunit [Aeropyrum camini SY1 = JCM 12091]
MMGVSWLEARVSVHATEDRDKVVKALSSILPLTGGGFEVVEDVFEGHYGNQIRVITVRLRDGRTALKVLEGILSRLPVHDRRYLLDTLEERVDKNGVLYLRVSKQDAYLGDVRVYEGDDVIRIAVGFQGGRKRAIRFYKSLLERLIDSEGNPG